MSLMILTKTIPVAAATGTVTIDLTELYSRYRITTSGAVTLSANLVFSTSGSAADGQTIEFLLPGSITLSSYSFTIFGVTIDSVQALKRGSIKLIWNATTGAWFRVLSPDWTETTVIGGNKIFDNSLSLSKLSGAGANEIITVNNSGVIGFTPVNSQKIPINNGTTIVAAEEASGSDISWTAASDQLDFQIKSGVIVNADINSAAAIARTKLASGTASHVVINDGSGVMSSEAQLAQERGGTNLDTSASTGFPTISSGTWSVNALTCTQRVDVSFDANRKGAYYVNFPFACTVTNVKIRATDLIEATDDGVINFKNNSGTNMGGSGLSSGNITITGGSVIGDGFTSTLTSNNTFTTDQEMRITTSKTTSGGNCSIDITYTRIS